MHIFSYSQATTSSRPVPVPPPSMDDDLENNKELSNDNTNNAKTPSMVRKKSDVILVTNNVRFQMLRNFMTNLQEVIFGTKLAVLFPAVPLAVVADLYSFGRVSIIHTVVIFPTHFIYTLAFVNRKC